MLFWIVYSFSQPMHSVQGAAYLFLSQSCTLWTLKKKVSIDFGPLKDKCEKYQMARWTYRQKITSYALMLFHFYRQLSELFKFPYIHRLPPAFFFTLFASNETPFSLLRQLLHTCRAWYSHSEQPWCARTSKGNCLPSPFLLTLSFTDHWS